MTMDEVINVLSLQEEILQFNHFTNEDAWQLGIMLVAESKKRGLDCSITIRKNNDVMSFFVCEPYYYAPYIIIYVHYIIYIAFYF